MLTSSRWSDAALTTRSRFAASPACIVQMEPPTSTKAVTTIWTAAAVLLL
jgi:hypothetical protein